MAVQSILNDTKFYIEGVRASPFAALKQNIDRFEGKWVALITCGGNIDTRILASTLIRRFSREGFLARLRITISDQPDALAKVAHQIGEAGGKIIEICHHQMFYDVHLKVTELNAVMETRYVTLSDLMVQRLETIEFPTRHLEDGNSVF